MPQRGGRVARLKDVAQAAGLSVAAVSRYLNHTLKLPPDTAGRVDLAIRQLHYKPNPHARRLSLGRSETLGLVIPDIANPFFAELADAVEGAAEAHGLGLLLCATRNRVERELDYLARLRRTQVDGLLFVTNHGDDGRLARAINAAGGVVLLDEDIKGARVPRVLADNEHGGCLAARHLMAAGHCRLGFVGGPPDLSSTIERRAGFMAAIDAAGGRCRIEFEICGDYSAQAGRDAAARMLDGGADVTAVFVCSDEVTLGFLDLLRQRGVSVPRDLSLVTFDDVGPLHLLHPPLTAIRQPVDELGRRGVDLLLEQMRGETPVRPPLRLGVRLVERGSVAAPAAAACT